MERVEMGSLKLSRIIQGFWRLTAWNMDTDTLVRFMNGCVERGVTTFDTAEIYGGGDCERQMGLAFQRDPGLSRKIELVTKTGIFKKDGFGYYNTGYDSVVNSCKESLRRLNLESIDLYLIHREDPCMDPRETARALKDLKKQGLIREAGVSNFDPFKFEALNAAMDGELVTNQIEWNPLCFEHFNSGMMDLLTGKKIRPMLWSPLAGGSLFSGQEPGRQRVRQVLETLAEKHGTDSSTIVYAWLMYHPCGALPISGSNKLHRLEQAIAALEIKLEHHEWYQIYAASGQQVLR